MFRQKFLQSHALYSKKTASHSMTVGNCRYIGAGSAKNENKKSLSDYSPHVAKTLTYSAKLLAQYPMISAWQRGAKRRAQQMSFGALAKKSLPDYSIMRVSHSTSRTTRCAGSTQCFEKNNLGRIARRKMSFGGTR